MEAARRSERALGAARVSAVRTRRQAEDEGEARQAARRAAQSEERDKLDAQVAEVAERGGGGAGAAEKEALRGDQRRSGISCGEGGGSD